MSNDTDFDFDFDSPEVDKVLDKADNVKKQPAAKRATGKRSGKASGSKSGTPPKRVPMHERMPLTADSRPGFKRRVVNDVPGRVDRLKLAGWTVVEDTSIGDTYAGQASSLGSAATKPVGRGVNGILMEIPEDLYNEDQAVKQKRVDDAERAMVVDAAEGASDKTGEWQGKIELSG